jgi:hypothetical protein
LKPESSCVRLAGCGEQKAKKGGSRFVGRLFGLN